MVIYISRKKYCKHGHIYLPRIYVIFCIFSLLKCPQPLIRYLFTEPQYLQQIYYLTFEKKKLYVYIYRGKKIKLPICVGRKMEVTSIRERAKFCPIHEITLNLVLALYSAPAALLPSTQMQIFSIFCYNQDLVSI